MVTNTLADSFNNSEATRGKEEIVNNIIRLAKEEQLRGNTSITEEKLNNLTNYVLKYQEDGLKKSSAGKTGKDSEKRDFKELPKIPKPKYSPLFNKFTLPKPVKHTKLLRRNFKVESFSFKKLERIVIEVLETLANLLDNLHLFSKFPMFPKKLASLLKQTNKLWVLILVFLLRKTISQLLNVIKKEKKVKLELSILHRNQHAKLLGEKDDDKNIFKRYEKFLKDLKFDKTMLILELIGNCLDLIFNVVELYAIPLPEWFMTGLNFTSMFMTIYRMNKDDEYVDDDITEDII